MGRRNNSIILFSVAFIACSLAFQNCSSLQRFIFLTSPVQAQAKKFENPINEMMSDSEQQIKNTREKLEKRNDLFGEQKLDTSKLGPKQRMNTDTGVTTEVFELEGSAETDLKDSKRKIATDTQAPAIDTDEDLTVDDIENSKIGKEIREDRP